MKIIVFGFKPDLHAWEFVITKTSDPDYVLVPEKLCSHSCGGTQAFLSLIKIRNFVLTPMEVPRYFTHLVK